jgi:predicted AlkP superfamily pyrophosphatase or phosphodiesterase
MNTLKYNSAILLIICIGILNVNSQTIPSTKASIEGFNDAPKLIVGIVIDQMRADYISRFWNKFSERGFKRLVNGGYLCENNYINYTQSETGPGHAAIYTGTTPSINGIVSNDWYSREKNDRVYCVDDFSRESVGTVLIDSNGKKSPANLLSNTIGDQLHLATNFKSKVIAISLKDRGAVLPGGFTSNGTFWYDNVNGKFITSDYYMDTLAPWVIKFNDRKVADSLMKLTWLPSLDIDKYSESTPDDVPYEGVLNSNVLELNKHTFPYYLNKDTLRKTKYKTLRVTPYGNTLLKEFALAALRYEELGKHSATDLFAISFSSTDYVGHNFGINSIELEDTYIKLDKDIAEILDYLEANIGKENLLIFLTADHGAANNVYYSKDHHIPAGLFDSKITEELLKAYLKEKFGVDNLILKFTNLNVYLNQKLIDEKKLSLYEIETAVANFLLKCEGVAYANIAFEIPIFENTYAFHKWIKNDYNAARSGDVLITLLPNWMEWGNTGTTHGSPYNYDTHIPLIFYGWKVVNGTYLPEVNITDIAPTIAHLLNIQPPNGCSGKPIPVPLNGSR